MTVKEGEELSSEIQKLTLIKPKIMRWACVPYHNL